MRCFVALDLPEGFVGDTADLSHMLAASVDGRFVPRENYHLTLAFIGEVGEDGARAAVRALDAACEGVAPIPLHANGLGHFGKPRDATLWLGIESQGRAEELAARVREALSENWVDYDSKAFRAHVTLARRARLPKDELPGPVFPGDDLAREVTLYRSTLSSEGATYKPLYTVILGA